MTTALKKHTAYKGLDVADAKRHFRAILEQVLDGETVRITRLGKAVAQISPVETTRKRIDLAALGNLTEAMPIQRESAGAFIRRMRNQERY